MIEQAPADASREFANWFSGFADARACFVLWMNRWGARKKPMPQASFVMALRGDDDEILQRISSHLGCGAVATKKLYVYPYTSPRKKPQSTLKVDDVASLWRRVVAHFDAYPLRTSKARDYAIWRDAVELMYEVSTRKVERQGRSGFLPRWTDEERARFAVLCEALKDVRQWEPAAKGV